MDGAALGTAALLSVFLMPIVSLIKKPTWRHEAKYLLGMAAALLAAIVGAFVDGSVKSVAEFVPYFGTALASAQTLYNLYFGNTEANKKLEEVGT
jgi:hypothetical protein